MMNPAAQAVTVPFPWPGLLTLLIILTAAVGVFWMLLRRWTSHRHWSEMAEWARGHQFRLHAPAMAEVPEPLSTTLSPHDPRARFALTDPQTILVQLETDTTPASRNPEQAARWNLLVRRLESNWPPAGLRPAAHRSSLLDFYGLPSYPSLLPPERFVVFAAEPDAARALAHSPVRGLLPADVGLMLLGQHLILDFSTRPFDSIEFGRMIALADQILAHLPAVNA